VQVLGLRQGLPGQDLRDVGTVLAHGDDHEPELQVGVALLGVVHAGEHGADRLARREAGEGVDDRRVAQLEGRDRHRGGRLDDRLGDLADVLVELRDPERIVHLVEIGEERPFLAFLDLQATPHLLQGLDGIQAIVPHQLPRDLRGDGAVDVLVQLDLREGLDAGLEVGHDGS
jgi:hypothetical protein